MMTWIEVDSAAIKHNLRQFRKLVGPKVMLMPVVKANAYGHGIFDMAKICEQSREVDRICVVNIDEALALKKHGIKKTIVILSFFDLNEQKMCSAIRAGIVFPIYDIKQAEKLSAAGKKLHKKAVIHIKIDTGTGRLGVVPSDVMGFVKQIQHIQWLQIEGIFSHLASSESDRVYTQRQLDVFEQTVSKIESLNVKFAVKHIACSTASVLYDSSRYNAVRLGLSMYGIYPDEFSKRRINLKPALSWHTKIAQIKTVPAWSKIGYGGTFTTKKTTKLAILPIGYWDGYDRGLSNKAQVLVGGKKCPVRGRICMNLCIVDVTAVKNVKAGDLATLIGRQKKAIVTADDLAEWADTINYEIVDRINPTLPRIVL